MRILFVGDVMGRSGREAVHKHLPVLKEKLKLDSIIVNGENAAHGAGITAKMCKEFYEDGADCITTGNHVWDQRDIITYIDSDRRLVRPVNYPPGTPGRGVYEHKLLDGRKIVIINAMGRLFMDALDDPFRAVSELLEVHKLRHNAQAILIDFHTETTSEKMAMGHYVDGRVSAVVGSHTHIPTADAHIMENGTAFQADAGMTGDYNSVIGIKKSVAVQRFSKKMPTERPSPADGEGTLCGIFIETEDKTGLSKRIEPVCMGPLLKESVPEL